MDGKTLLLFVILPIGVVAFLVYISLDTWRDIQQTVAPSTDPDVAVHEEATRKQPPRPPKKAAPASARKADAEAWRVEAQVRALVSSGEKAERTGVWRTAHDHYAKAAAKRADDALKRRVWAMDRLINAEDLERQGKLSQAIICYRQALPYSVDRLAIERRVRRVSAMAEPAEPPPEPDRAPVKVDKPAEKPADEKPSEMANVTKLLASLAKKRLHYARLVVCLACLQDPLYAKHDDALKTPKAKAVTAIEAEDAPGIAPAATKPRKVTVVSLKDGSRVIGRVVGSARQWIKLEVEESGVAAKKLIARKQIASLKEETRSPEEINDERAAALLQQALAHHKAGRAYDCLDQLGRLWYAYPRTPLLSDTARQKALLSSEPPAGADKGDLDLPRLMSLALRAGIAEARRLEYACPACEGTLRKTCPRCEGKGVVQQVCRECIGGQAACPYCEGVGRYPCKRCDGKGWMRCNKCGGKGIIDSRPGVTIYCAACGGKGRKDCPACRDGVADCPECKDGRVPCRFCDGKGKKEATCPVCRGRKTVPCDACGGTGKRR